MPASRSRRIPRPRTSRVRVLHGGHDFRDACRDERVRAGRVRPLCEHGSSVRYRVAPRALLAGLFQREHLGVLHAGPGVEAASDHLPVLTMHRAHGGIRAGAAQALARRVRAPLQWYGFIFQTMTATNSSGSNGSRSSTFSPTPT